MKDATYIKVKEGKLWASDMVKPDNPGEFNYPGLGLLEEIAAYEKAMEALNQSFIEVEDVHATSRLLADLNNKGKIKLSYGLYFGEDGLYPISGLQFEVRETEFGHVDDYSKPHGFRKVAILSLKQEQK